MYISKEEFLPSAFGFVVAHTSRLKRAFDPFIRFCHEFGLMIKWRRKHLPDKNKCLSLEGQGTHHHHELDVKEMASILELVLVGLALGFACLVIEFITVANCLLAKEISQGFVRSFNLKSDNLAFDRVHMASSSKILLRRLPAPPHQVARRRRRRRRDRRLSYLSSTIPYPHT